ncbi:hypothetical protein FKN01_19575 [Streptomyces sp. 130]|uniref:ArgS-related anticodon-binding protein NrtL n=1 Tax=Streptomyces sp. 130 TaxID=2591006 RepID=UPI00117EFEF7|nr:DALR anticodon-binding domain-containing protein [Streptomyces sp. 130]TRV76089.1 hypothetical protein FKN01_19575 [Streptomyces sp. 130]
MTPVDLSTTVLHAVRRAVREDALRGPVPARVRVERTRPGGRGDYASAVALQLAGPAGLAAREVAEILRDRLAGAPGVAGVEITGPGFLNFTLDAATGAAAHRDLVHRVREQGERYGYGDALAGQRSRLVHAREVRAAVTADAVRRLLAAQGADVSVSCAGAPDPDWTLLGVALGAYGEPPHADRATPHADRPTPHADWPTPYAVGACGQQPGADRAAARAVGACGQEPGVDRPAPGAVSGDQPRTAADAEAAANAEHAAAPAAANAEHAAADAEAAANAKRAAADAPERAADAVVAANAEVAASAKRAAAPAPPPIPPAPAGAPAGARRARRGPDAARWGLLRAAGHDRAGLGPELIAQTEANALFRVRYAHARARAVVREAARLGVAVAGHDEDIDATKASTALLTLLDAYPAVLAAAARHRAPDRLARHLEAVAAAFFDFHDAAPPLPVGDEKPSAAHRSRTALAEAAGTVLAGGLSLLGVSAPEHL